MEPLAVQRQGAGHDGAPSGDTASASYLRTLLRSGRTNEALSYLPAPAAQVLRRELALGQAPADLSYCQRAILARLRQLREEDFLPYEDVYKRQARSSGFILKPFSSPVRLANSQEPF